MPITYIKHKSMLLLKPKYYKDLLFIKSIPRFLQYLCQQNMIISILTLLLGFNLVYCIYNGHNIPNPLNGMLKYPWMIRIAIVFDPMMDLDEGCDPVIEEYFGGTLITSSHILTVAHPFQKYIEEDPKAFKLGYKGIAYAGVYSKSELPDPGLALGQTETEGAKAEVVYKLFNRLSINHFL